MSDKRRSPHTAAPRSLVVTSRGLWLDLPAVVMIAAFVALALFCRLLLSEAAAGRPSSFGGLAFWSVVLGFLLATGAVLVAQCLRMAHRIAGPEHRLRAALQRIRTGDVGFRIALRRGDPLQELAYECNELLDWLNQNPPAGARTGGDIVEVAHEELEEVAP